MPIKFKPPMHRADLAAGILIPDTDSSWNLAKVADDRLVYEARALDAKREAAVEAFVGENPDASETEVEAVRAACFLTGEEARAAGALSPVLRYHAGITRFQPNAPDTDAHGRPVTIREDYIIGKPDVEFALRRLRATEYHEIGELGGHGGARTRLLEAFRAGLVGIRAEGYSWKAKPDEQAGDEQLEVVFAAGENLPLEIGAAVMRLSRALDEDEKKSAPVGA